jgi:hypothetical protein
MSQRLYATSSVIDVLLSMPEREWKAHERSVCRGAWRMDNLTGVSTHLSSVANKLRKAAQAEQRDDEQKHLMTEAKRWTEMARKASLLAQRRPPKKQS